ncbi:hypothetical protein D9M72_427010 [compost metagenome]
MGHRRGHEGQKQLALLLHAFVERQRGCGQRVEQRAVCWLQLLAGRELCALRGHRCLDFGGVDLAIQRPWVRKPLFSEHRRESGGCANRVPSHDVVEQARLGELAGALGLPAGHQRMGGSNAHQPGQPLGCTRAGNQAQGDLRQTDPGLFLRDAPMAAQSEFKATAQGDTGDGRHDGLAARLDAGDDRAQNGVLQLARRAELGGVRTGGECLLIAGQHDAAHCGISQRGIELLHDAFAQRVAQAVDGRVDQRDDGDAVADVKHGQPHAAFIRCLPTTSCWICVVPSYRRSRRTSR